MKKYLFAGMAMLFCACSTTLWAQTRADSHAPIGVMGDHTHNKGEWMISYRYMFMKMQDNLQGDEEISPDEIVTTIDNPFFGMPNMPPTLRVVPLEMDMHMHMIGGMYAPSDRLTLMAMLMFTSMSMDHVTYQGGMGTNVLGKFTTKSSGLGDTRIAAMYKLNKNFHVNLGLSIPTGSIDNEDEVLTPMETRPTLRMPYPMQLGSGTWDVLPGITYRGSSDHFAWGGQVMGNVRLGTNSEDYSLGNILQLTGWASYLFTNAVSASARVSFQSQGSIDGQDPQIMAPVQTANPDNFGGEIVSAGIGVNLAGQSGFVKNQRLAFEFTKPLYQNLNGVQMKTDMTLTVGWQYAF